MQEHPSTAQALRAFAPQPVPREKERRRVFGIFGGRRRVEPQIAIPRAAATPPALPPQPSLAVPTEPQAAASARDPDGRPQQQAPAGDLFADVAENDRFEIPAFLRRQAKMGS
jgi:hypothetical protein